jgi:hypothetical protein
LGTAGTFPFKEEVPRRDAEIHEFTIPLKIHNQALGAGGSVVHVLFGVRIK